jgi:hypothetical protein
METRSDLECAPLPADQVEPLAEYLHSILLSTMLQVIEHRCTDEITSAFRRIIEHPDFPNRQTALFGP